MKSLLSFAAATAVAFTASMGSAATYNLSLDGLTHGAVSNTVRIHQTPVGPTGRVVAGGFKMSDNGNVLSDFIAFCLDLGSYMRDDTLYESTNNPFTNFTIPVARVQALFDANWASIDMTNLNQSAGFQLALWEAIYDNDFSLSTGAFRGEGLAGATTTASQGFLTAASLYTGPQNFQLSFFESLNQPRSQNLVTVTPMPLPAGGAMLLAALGFFGFMRRRSARA